MGTGEPLMGMLYEQQEALLPHGVQVVLKETDVQKQGMLAGMV
jgi:hypothetical protein